MDCFNYVNINNPKARETVLGIILEHNFDKLLARRKFRIKTTHLV